MYPVARKKEGAQETTSTSPYGTCKNDLRNSMFWGCGRELRLRLVIFLKSFTFSLSGMPCIITLANRGQKQGGYQRIYFAIAK